MDFNDENTNNDSRECISATITLSGRDIDGIVAGAVSQAIDGKTVLSLAVMQQLLEEAVAKINAKAGERVNAAIDRLTADFAETLCAAIEVNNKKRLETPPTIENHGLVSRGEAEEILRSSYATVYKLMRNGVLDPVYIGRKLYFHREQVEDVLRDGFTGGKRRTRTRKRTSEDDTEQQG